MPVQNTVRAVERGLEFLASRQLPSGQFPVEVTCHTREGITIEPDAALFATAHIVYSLGFLPQPSARAMIACAMTYFQAEMSGHGLWRYWDKAAKRGENNLYAFIPADLDDMSNISFLLRRYGVRFPDNRKLMLLNRNRAGLFYTWLMLRPTPTLNLRYWHTVLSEITIPRFTVFWAKTEAGYRDVDGVVNANVLLYLGECRETRNVISWLIDIVHKGEEATCDKWYRDPFTFYYALSRNYHEGIQTLDEVRPQILARLAAAAQENGQIGENALHTALAANVLCNFGERSSLLERAISFLLHTQSADGTWESVPYYYGGPLKVTSWGSRELTTGLCLEALYRFTT